MRSWLGGAVIAIALTSAACGRFGFDSTGDEDPDTPDVDSGTSNVEADAASDAAPFVDPLGAFNEPAPLVELAGVNAIDPTLRADLLEMFIEIDGDIFHVLRSTADEPFGGLREIGAFNSVDAEATPKLDPRGATMFFASQRAGGLGDHDIYMSTRPATSWTAPVAITQLSSDRYDGSATTTLDLLTVVFVSNRDGGRDLYMSRRDDVSDLWEAPLPLINLNSNGAEDQPFITANGLELYFCSTREGGLGGHDIYMAVRDDDSEPFGAPQLLTELNSPQDDCGVWLSPDRHEIWFTSDRGDSVGIYRADR